MRNKQEAERKHIQAFVDRFRYKASKARQAQSRLKALERMEPLAAVAEDRYVIFQFPKPEKLPPPILRLEQASAGYAPGQAVLTNLDLRLDMDDRVALLGPNGNGKSTLMRLLAERLQPMGGEKTGARKLRVGYFAQDQADELDYEATALQQMARVLPKATERQLRSQLGAFGFGEDRVKVTVGNLSGGEKARLLFALVTRHSPHLLLLDEPTNHLDIDTRQALVEAIADFDGAVVLVSHDSELVRLVADRLWLVADGTVAPYEGDLDDYRKLLLEEKRGREPKGERAGKAEAGNLSKKDKRRAAAAARQANLDLHKAVRHAEARIAKLTEEKAKLEAKLAEPEVYEGPTAKLQSLQVRHSEIKAALDKAEEAWLTAQDALEATRAAAS